MGVVGSSEQKPRPALTLPVVIMGAGGTIERRSLPRSLVEVPSYSPDLTYSESLVPVHGQATVASLALLLPGLLPCSLKMFGGFHPLRGTCRFSGALVWWDGVRVVACITFFDIFESGECCQLLCLWVADRFVLILALSMI